MSFRIFWLVFSVSLVGTGALAAQDTVVVRGDRLRGSSRIARQAVDLFNADRTVRFFGPARVAVDEVYTASVAVLDGPLVVAGVIRGDLVALNADVDLTADAEVDGDIIVLGGTLTGLDRAVVSGNTRRHRAGVDVRRVGDRLELVQVVRETVRIRSPRRWWRRSDGRFSFRVSTGRTYNRVEGLPFEFGPRLEWNRFGSPYILLEGYGVFRTAGDFDGSREDIGYSARAEVDVGRRGGVTVGGRVYDLVVPVEDWQLGDEEIGLGTFFFHRDYRDYFLRRGGAGFLTLRPTAALSLTGEIARHEETSIAARDPYTLFRGDDPWRRNPIVDEGHFTTVRARLELDDREERARRESGWYVGAEWERGTSDDVEFRALPGSVRGTLPPAGESYTYHRVFVDLRRYQRVGWGGQLSLRAVGAGTVGDQSLPLQRRLSLGGPDPLPGYTFRRFACNEGVGDVAQPALCDRVLLFQAEYRGAIDFWGGWDRPGRHHRTHRDDFDWDDWYWFDGPTIVLFGNAGSAWLDTVEDGPGDFEFDVGAGLEFGSMGIYVARALQEGESFRVSLRVQRRF